LDEKARDSNNEYIMQLNYNLFDNDFWEKIERNSDLSRQLPIYININY